jgi:hypothetical protein
MATEMSLVNFRDAVEGFAELKIEQLTRPDLGSLGLPSLEGAVAQLRSEIRVISSVAKDSSDQELQRVTAAYKEYLSTLNQIASLTAQRFVAERSDWGQVLARQWNDIRQVWPYFATLGMAKNGLLEGPDSALERIRLAVEDTETKIKKVADEVILQAKAQADRIEENARKTARGFSVKAAQDQFDHASRSLNGRAGVWGIAGGASFAWFVWFAFHVYRNPPAVFAEHTAASSPGIPEAIYLTAIRITILTAIGALATFCLKMLRAHLHMSALNDHRRRIANSMAAFVESAHSAEHRDQIFGRLVDAVVAFGESGILDKEVEGVSVPAIAIDAITKNLTSKG